MKRSITVPEYCLVLLVGPSGSGKSTFAATHFKATEVVSSDRCRGIVSDDENSLEATGDAFDLLHFIVEKRLAARRLTVVDATSVRSEDRRSLVALAKKHHALAVAFVFNMPEDLCQARNAVRPDRQFGPHVVRNHVRALRKGLKRMEKEGIRYVHRFTTSEEVDAVAIIREKLWVDKRELAGPFDIIGDIHGCADELEALLAKLGYRVAQNGAGYRVASPDGRTAVFLGDLVDRGPRIPDVLRLVRSMVEAGVGLCVCGNHENKLIRLLKGRNVKLTYGLADTVEQFDAEGEDFGAEMLPFLDSLISHYVLDGGKLVVAHAGLIEGYQNRSSGKVRSFALYGETTGETDEFGLPVRHNWAAEYAGSARVVYGHTPVPEAEWVNGTICIDTGCVFGGKLTALRYPEMELVDVQAAKVYSEPVRPLEVERPAGTVDTQLDIARVLGKQVISTELRRAVTVREEQAVAALEVMSRFAIDPRWLIYLPPTMSPCKTSAKAGYLEHPDEAFAYYRDQGVGRVVVQEKHMGSRAVLLVARSGETAARRFGTDGSKQGVVFTRTGRAFFSDTEVEAAVVARIADAIGQVGWWERFETDWVCLDAEIMPWSVKAQALIEQQYAPVGAAARAGLARASHLLGTAVARGVPIDALAEKTAARSVAAASYREAYNHYVWPVAGLDDLKIAPFHLLATEGAVHTDKDHGWHMAMLAELAGFDQGLLLPTTHHLVDLSDQADVAQVTEWWERRTGEGGEGMVVKPLDFVARGKRGLVQPAVKCRGRNYLRIIYGPDYDAPEHLDRLRKRGLGQKRVLALSEFALGLEALTRFAHRAPLAHVHECVFGVLALESEPVDPRL